MSRNVHTPKRAYTNLFQDCEILDRAYEERLNECGITTAETRRVEVFNILNGYANLILIYFFKLKKAK